MAQTWTSIGPRSVKQVCTTATEAAPSAATDGCLITDLDGLTIHVEADSGQTLSGAGTLKAWLYNDNSGVWSRAPDLDKTTGTSGVRSLSFLGDAVVSARGRIAYEVSGVTASSGSRTVYYLATVREDFKIRAV
jgi:hypothetical protein